MNATNEELKAAARRLAEREAEPGTTEASIAAQAAVIYRRNLAARKRLTEAAVERKRREYRII